MADIINQVMTADINSQLERCEDTDDLQQILLQYSGYYFDWKTRLNELIRLYAGGRQSVFAKRCGLSLNTVKRWGNTGGGMPRGRKEFLKIAFGLGLNLEETNELLQRYGRYNKLYAKNIEDAICIFCIENQMNFKEYDDIKHDKLISKCLTRQKSPETLNYLIQTDALESRIQGIRLRMDFILFIEQNLPAFLSGYERLIQFIDDYVKANNGYSPENREQSLNALLVERIGEPRLVSMFNDMISDLKCYRSIPEKSKLIALGLYLNMSLDDVNIMLDMAGMARLCAKDKLDGILIYALNSFILNNPYVEYSNAYLLSQYSDDPIVYKHCKQVIELHSNFANIKEPDIVIDDVVEYVRIQLQNIAFAGKDELYDLFADLLLLDPEPEPT